MRAILTYHSIDPSGSPISCHPDAFAAHLDWLASGQVAVTTIDQLMDLPPEANAVAVTFDDGYVNFGELAAPRLLDRGFPVTVFVVSDFAGTTNSWDDGPGRTTPQLPLLDWPALIRLQELGVTLGAHSRTHADLSRLDDGRIEQEVGGCVERMQMRTGMKPEIFAYPYGHTSAAGARAVQQTFRFGCTTEFRVLGSAEVPALLPRLDMYYFQRPESLTRWGKPSFDARIRIRQLARRFRGMALDAASRSGMRRS